MNQPLKPSDAVALATTVERLLGRRPEEVPRLVGRAVRHLVGADGASVVLRSGRRLRYMAEDGVGPLWRRTSIDRGVSSWVIEHAQRALVDDVAQATQFPVDAFRATLVKSLAVVPMSHAPGVEPMGAIGAYWARLHPATLREVELLEALARATAWALRNADESG